MNENESMNDVLDEIEREEDGRNINLNITPIQAIDGVVAMRWSGLIPQLQGALQIVLANAVASANGEGVVRYSRNSGGRISKKYNKMEYARQTYLKAVDILEQDGWIKNVKSVRNTGIGKIRSKYVVKRQLLDYFSIREILEQEYLNIKTAQTIIVRDKKGNPVEYRETSNIVGMRNVVTSLNLVNSGFNIEHMGLPLDASSMVRIFKGGHKKGGRWYRCGIQQIKQRNKDGTDVPLEETRLGVLINGGHVVEVDFNSLHPMLMCAEYDISPQEIDGDIYQHILGPDNTNKVDRYIVKHGLLRIINTDSVESAQGAIQKLLKENEGSSFFCPSEVYNAIKKSLPEMSIYFHTTKGYGLHLQYIDSMIVEEVANVFIEAGKPLLPVHDSFVVKEEDENMLIKAMCQSFRKVTGNDNIPIGLKIKRWDGSEEHYID